MDTIPVGQNDVHGLLHGNTLTSIQPNDLPGDRGRAANRWVPSRLSLMAPKCQLDRNLFADRVGNLIRTAGDRNAGGPRQQVMGGAVQ